MNFDMGDSEEKDPKETYNTVLEELRELNDSFVYPQIIKRVNQELNLTTTIEDSGCAVDYFREHKGKGAKVLSICVE